jgi:hypothetical protein
VAGSGHSSTKVRARSIAHRWGPAVAIGKDDLWALGVRYDEEDDTAGETFLVRLAPGKAELVDQVPGLARDFCAQGERTFLLDAKGALHVAGKRHRLATPRALVATPQRVIVAADDRLWLVDPAGDVERGPKLRARALAAAGTHLVAVLDDGGVVAGSAPDALAGLDEQPDGHLAHIAVDDEGRIAAASGRQVFFGDAKRLRPLAAAPFEIHAIALFHGRVYFSSRAHGLFAVDDNKAVPVRPSLRAHHLTVGAGLLVCASDLFLAYADADLDWMTRDLAPFVRLADTRMPRFVDPDVTV